MTALALHQIVANALADVGLEGSLPPALRGRPRRTTWHEAERGFGIRHYSSGRQIYVVQTKMGGRVKTVTIGPASVISLHQARSVARLVMAWSLVGHDPAAERKRARQAPAFKDFLSEYWRRWGPRWKPSTMETNTNYRELYLDTAFTGKFIDEISEADVARWFTATTDRAGPGGANRVFSVLKAAFYKAERWGYRPDGTNPCAGVKPNRTKPRERHLSSEELASLGRTIDHARKGADPYRADCASAILLLLLTGCRSGEIMSACWSDIRGNRLRLRDSKTGPRTVWLGPAAQKVINEVPRRKGVDWLFWNARLRKRIAHPLIVWRELRVEAGLGDARLHDLRHTFASQAAMGSETLPMVGRLLGHAYIGSTMRYAHHDDVHLLDAAQQVGALIVQLMGSGPNLPSRQSVTLP